MHKLLITVCLVLIAGCTATQEEIPSVYFFLFTHVTNGGQTVYQKSYVTKEECLRRTVYPRNAPDMIISLDCVYLPDMIRGGR